MKNKFYFDEIYEATFIRAHDFIAAVVDVIDRWIVEGACIGLIRGGTDFTGRVLRLVQTGNLQTYAFLFVFGVAVVLYLSTDSALPLRAAEGILCRAVIR